MLSIEDVSKLKQIIKLARLAEEAGWTATRLWARVKAYENGANTELTIVESRELTNALISLGLTYTPEEKPQPEQIEVPI